MSRLLLGALLAGALFTAGCQSDQGQTVSADEQKKVEAAAPLSSQNANIPPQAKAAALKGRELGRTMGQFQGR